MKDEKIEKKPIRCSIKAWKETYRRKTLKEKSLADAGHPREVTLGEIVAEALGVSG